VQSLCSRKAQGSLLGTALPAGLQLRNRAEVGRRQDRQGTLRPLPFLLAHLAHDYSSVSFHLEQQFPRGTQAKKRDRLSQNPKISSLQGREISPSSLGHFSKAAHSAYVSGIRH